MGLTQIDWAEKAGQLMYAVLLCVFPTFWSQDTFVSQDVPVEMVCFLRVLGNLVVCIIWISWIARTMESCNAYIGLVDLCSAIAWGACAVNTLLHKDLMKPDRLVLNMVVQAGLAAAFVYQYQTRAAPSAARIELTQIDWVEKLLQGLYTVACLAFPALWCEQNLTTAGAVTAEGFYIISASGVLIAAIVYLTYVMRSHASSEAVLTQLDLCGAVVWTSGCVIWVWYKDLLVQDKLGLNMVLQLGMAVAMLYQSTTRGAGARKVAAGAEMTQPFRQPGRA